MSSRNFAVGKGGATRASRRACISCRSMKMKCEGSDRPPCIRCRRAGRQCEPPSALLHVPMQNEPMGQTPYQNGSGVAPPALVSSSRNFSGFDLANLSCGTPRGTAALASLSPTTAWVSGIGSADITVIQNTTPREDTQGPVSSSDENELHSIYTTSVVDTLNHSYGHQGSETPQSGRLSGGAIDRDKPASISAFDRQEAANARRHALSRPDILDMLGMFRDKILPLVPALDPGDPVFADEMIEANATFAHCICYVTAKFLPGGRELRRALMPEIRNMLITNSNMSDPAAFEDLAYMKILLVLFAYSKFNSPSSQTTLAVGDDILYWPLKSIVEMKALRLSLHNSLRDLRRSMSTNDPWPIVSASTAYTKYLISLQLFVMAH
ncbi:hypothetical protein BJX65DRAFT_279609 [Aspergillus insuetus]